MFDFYTRWSRMCSSSFKGKSLQKSQEEEEEEILKALSMCSSLVTVYVLVSSVHKTLEQDGMSIFIFPCVIII